MNLISLPLVSKWKAQQLLPEMQQIEKGVVVVKFEIMMVVESIKLVDRRSWIFWKDAIEF